MATLKRNAAAQLAASAAAANNTTNPAANTTNTSNLGHVDSVTKELFQGKRKCGRGGEGGERESGG